MQQFLEELGAPVPDINIERQKSLETLFEWEKEQYQKEAGHGDHHMGEESQPEPVPEKTVAPARSPARIMAQLKLDFEEEGEDSYILNV